MCIQFKKNYLDFDTFHVELPLIIICYVDTSILLENMPLLKFIGSYIWGPSVSDIYFHFFASVNIIKTKWHVGVKIWILFSYLKNKIVSLASLVDKKKVLITPPTPLPSSASSMMAPCVPWLILSSPTQLSCSYPRLVYAPLIFHPTASNRVVPPLHLISGRVQERLNWLFDAYQGFLSLPLSHRPLIGDLMAAGLADPWPNLAFLTWILCI